MDLLLILFLISQKTLYLHRPRQVLPPTTSAPMTKAIKMKRVMTMLQQKITKTKNLHGFEVNLEGRLVPDIDNLPLDKNAAQIVQQGHPLAKRLPL
jgi:hypothetical protein